MAVNDAFDGTYAGRRVLVTGHTGFKGSWLCAWLTRLGARVAGLALAPDTEPNHWNLLALDTVESHIVDLRDAHGVATAYSNIAPDIVFHLAAQPLVRRSYRSPVDTFASNVMGLIHLYEAIRRDGRPTVVVNATTDKVYRPPVPEGGYRETDPLGGHDPYSASKACAELVGESWRSSWFASGGVRLATARAGNVIGGGDWAEDRLVPDLVRAALAGEPLAVRNPHAVRPWQHVLEPLSGYLRLGQALLAGDGASEAWNFGPDLSQELSVEDLVRRFVAEWPGTRWVADTGPHPHEAARLLLDSRKAAERLGWRPLWSADQALARTVGWYRRWQDRGELATDDDIAAYTQAAKAAGSAWAAGA